MKDPYTPTPGRFFNLPENGGQASMDDIVSVYQPQRYRLEVMALQMAIGTEPDGVIGPKTREAARGCPSLLDLARNVGGIDDAWLQNTDADLLRTTLCGLRQEAHKVLDAIRSS